MKNEKGKYSGVRIEREALHRLKTIALIERRKLMDVVSDLVNAEYAKREKRGEIVLG